MAKESEHGKIIAAAAKAALAPLDCTRVGRSRLWILDQGAWAIIIEFQPSGFSKGSYLNVAASWLWRERENRSWSFDYGHPRIGNFVPLGIGQSASIEVIEDFKAGIEQLATLAAQEVVRLRDELNCGSAITKKLTEFANEIDSVWPTYHAAIATGLSGEMTSSRSFFNRIIALSREPDWFAQLQDTCVNLANKLSNREAFRSAVLAIISRSRAVHRLPEQADCLVDW